MMSDKIRTDAIVTLRHAAEANNAEAARCRTDADKMQADVNELRARAGWFTAMADRWDRIATFIENGTFDLDYLLSGDDLDEARRAGAATSPAAADEATEAFVDVADAERYAQRDEYVNATDAEDEKQQEQQLAQERWFATEVLGLDGDRDFGEQLRERGDEAESEAAQEAWIAQREAAVDEAQVEFGDDSTCRCHLCRDKAKQREAAESATHLANVVQGLREFEAYRADNAESGS